MPDDSPHEGRTSGDFSGSRPSIRPAPPATLAARPDLRTSEATSTLLRPSRPGQRILIAVGLSAGPATALGLARFAYALLLPSMRQALHWSFATAALMNTANAAGYLIGALAAAWLSHRLGARRVFLGGLVLTGLLMLACAATGTLTTLLVLRLLTGFASAGTFIVGGALTAQLGHGTRTSHGALLLGVYVGGGGLGIAVSGLVVPALLANVGGAAGWRYGWVALAIISGVAAVAAAPAVRRTPVPPEPRHTGRVRLRSVRVLTIAYGLYGAGYIAYVTFIVAYLQAGGAGSGEISAFWVVLGLAAIAGGFVWSRVLARLPGGRGPAMMIAIAILGALLPLLARTPEAAFASAVLFGVSFLTVVTSVTQVARLSVPPPLWTTAIGVLTTGFALGQCLGPILSGVLADTASGIRAGLLLSVGVLLAAAVTSLAVRPQPIPAETATSSTGSAAEAANAAR